MHDDLTLLAQARTLDSTALAKVHDLYYGPIFRYVLMRVSDHQLAEDLTSEVFVRFLRALRDKTAPQNSLKGWLYRVASFVVSDHFRAHYKVQHTELHDALPGRDEPSTTVDTILTWENIQTAMQDLTDDQQNVIGLRFGYGMPIREVAQTIGKSEGAVKQLQARAIAALTRKLRRDG